MYELIGENSYFVYHREMEYLFVALEQLAPNGFNQNIGKVYGAKKEVATAGKFRWLFEVFQSMNKDFNLGILEFFMNYDMEKFTLKGYEEYLVSLTKEEFLSIYFQGISKEEFLTAIQSETGEQEFYEKHPDLFSQYIAFQFFFQDTQNLIHMFFTFVESLKNESVEQYLDSQKSTIEAEMNVIMQELKTKEPFSYSEELMGKNCYNRGPYKTFYFFPSVFFPVLFCRVFEKDQVLFYDFQRLREKKQNIPEQLKAMADNTRYRILLLLNKEEHLTGVEIAKKMKLATSTVSHHMNALRDSGLVHEEPVGSTKCYSISKRAIQNCIKVLQDTFLQ